MILPCLNILSRICASSSNKIRVYVPSELYTSLNNLPASDTKIHEQSGLTCTQYEEAVKA